jgi:hypothetical protein
MEGERSQKKTLWKRLTNAQASTSSAMSTKDETNLYSHPTIKASTCTNNK